ncbi:MAG: hypothetical protein K1W18_07105 [Oscillospiraceae bacterium]
MDRLTARINGYPHGKCGKNFDIALKNKSYNRGCFECTAIIERLCEYEDTGLSPAEVITMKAEYSDTFQTHLNELLEIKDKQIAVLQALCEEMENTAKEYRAFKEFFDALYGRNLTVGNWHLNGALEPFDNFYDKAVDEMGRGHESDG